MQKVVSFHKLKLTNNISDKHGFVSTHTRDPSARKGHLVSLLFVMPVKSSTKLSKMSLASRKQKAAGERNTSFSLLTNIDIQARGNLA
jgi:hypothetical protein